LPAEVSAQAKKEFKLKDIKNNLKAIN